MNNGVRQWVSLLWLTVKMAVFVALSLEAAEIVVIAYQRF